MRKINPYFLGARAVALRLFWDINYKSWISRKRLIRYRNLYKDQRAVILCNGPSLNKTNFDLLTGVTTFGLNKINLLFKRVEFRPSFIVSVNKFVIEQNKSFFNETQIPLFIDSSSRQFLKFRDNLQYLHSSQFPGFAEDCSISINQGYTVTYVAMQLAFHMGFKDVALIGCDHSFATKGPSNKTEIATGADQSHFDPSYFSDGMKWQLPDLVQSELHYLLAKETYENSGRRIVNCTNGGKLELFQRMNLEDWIYDET